ncbi:MAG TPA: HEPN domain-containing protein [Terriglobia bacterium]|nr:HEPN domain-containing protein [Terriglobia bacterium]
MGTSRSDFQWLAKTRIQEAKALLEKGLFDGAYYLAGYAVECALKACIVKKIRRSELPDKTLINDLYTHNLMKLLGLADLQVEYKVAIANKQFAANWDVVKNWSEEARYKTLGRLQVTNAQPPPKIGPQGGTAEERALELYNAITNPRYGVLPWLKKFW